MHHKSPKKEEQIILDCLKRQGYENLVFEPIHNKTPDILLNDNIAIEVRRLNHNRLITDGFEGLEQYKYSIIGKLKKSINKTSIESFDQSISVSLTLTKPLEITKKLDKDIKNILNDYKLIMNRRKKYDIDEHIELDFLPLGVKLDKPFIIGIVDYLEMNGFIVDSIYNNLKLVIDKKQNSIKENRSKYPIWWLAVVDYIGYGIGGSDIEQFYKKPKLEYEFDRILVVSPLDVSNFRFLYE